MNDSLGKWVKRCSHPFEGESEIGIRQVYQTEDFGAEFTPELRQQEECPRAQAAENTKEKDGQVGPEARERGCR